jgi:hypothetical protein
LSLRIGLVYAPQTAKVVVYQNSSAKKNLADPIVARSLSKYTRDQRRVSSFDLSYTKRVVKQ